MGFFDQASKKFAEVQRKTGDTIAVYKLQSQIKNIDEDIQRLYTSIGEICYMAHKTGKEPEGIAAIYENIDRMNEEKAELNANIDTLNGIEKSLTLQNSLFDAMLKGLLPLACTFLVFYLMKKKNWSTNKLLLVFGIGGFILGALQILSNVAPA